MVEEMMRWIWSELETLLGEDFYVLAGLEAWRL